MVNSRQKGKRGELEARDAVREHWYAPACIRAAQANGKHSADLLNALPAAHVEIKRYKKIAATGFMEQAVKDAAPGEIPVVLMRQDGSPDWLVMHRIQDSFAFADRMRSREQRPHQA